MKIEKFSKQNGLRTKSLKENKICIHIKIAKWAMFYADWKSLK